MTDSSYWEHSEKKFFGPLHKAMAATGYFDPEFTLGDIQRAFGIIEVNNYELANKSGNCGIRRVAYIGKNSRATHE